MQDYLTESQIIKIEALCKDEELLDGIKKVLLAGIYTHGVEERGHKPNPLQNGALSLVSLSTNNPLTDEVLGQHIRGVWEGLNALENGFNRLLSIKKGIETPYTKEENEAI